MKLAVVIPALDEAERIEHAIESARAPDVEILVVDGGSRDGTPERAQRAGARLTRSGRGRACQLATGAEECGGDVVLFLHADTRLPANWVAAVRGALADPGVAGGAFALGFDGDGALLRFLEWGARIRTRWAGLPYGDQAIFVRRSVLDAMGGVPQVPICEDLDLVRGMGRRGRVALLADAVGTSPRRYEKRGHLRTFLRNAVTLVAWRLGFDRARLAAWYRQ